MISNLLIQDLPSDVLLKILQNTKSEKYDKIFKKTDNINTNIESFQRRIITLEQDTHSINLQLKIIVKTLDTIMPLYNLLSIYFLYKIVQPFFKLILFTIRKTKYHIFEIFKYLLLLLPSIYNLKLNNIKLQQ